MDNNDIRKRFDTLYSDRKTVESQWQAIERFVALYKGKFFNANVGESGIDWRESRDVYDATAVQAHIQLASSIHGALTNPAIQWFEMQWRNQLLRKHWASQNWIEKAAKRVFDELQDSNFNLEANNCYRSLTSFATAIVTEEPKADVSDPWRGLQFTSVPLKEAYFEPDDQGQCLNFYRHLQWRASKIVARFGLDNVPDTVKTKYEANSDEQISVIFCAWTRKPGQPPNPGRTLTPENRPIGWKYILRTPSPDKETLDEGGYYEMPAYAVRWETTSESMWGHGPAHYAIADILTLNQLVELDIKSREKVIDPAILAQERALLSQLRLGPGEVNAVRDVDGIKAFESAARFDAVESSIARLQRAIQRYFYIDQLELKESPAMTATEVQVRYEMMQRLLSSTMSRLKEDFLNPLLQRTFNLLYRAGEFPPLPDIARNEEFDIEYIGPLSRSMKFDQSASIERWITQLQLIANSGEDAQKVLKVPDYDEIARQAAQNLNLPTSFTRPKPVVETEIRQDELARRRAAAADVALTEAETRRNIDQSATLRQGDQGIAPGATLQ